MWMWSLWIIPLSFYILHIYFHPVVMELMHWVYYFWVQEKLVYKKLKLIIQFNVTSKCLPYICLYSLTNIENYFQHPVLRNRKTCWQIVTEIIVFFEATDCRCGVPTFRKIWPVLNKERAASERNLAELSRFPRLLLYWPLMKLWVSATDNICVCIQKEQAVQSCVRV